MHNYQRSSLGNYFTQNETGRYFAETAGSMLDAATFGLAGDLYKMAVDTDIETGGLVSSAQDAIMKPSIMLADALVGNTDAGKNWLTFFQDNFLLSGHKRAREQARSAAADGVEDTSGTKRRKIDDGPQSINREINTNNMMQGYTGLRYQLPRDIDALKERAMGRVPPGLRSGEALRQMHSAMARLQSY